MDLDGSITGYAAEKIDLATSYLAVSHSSTVSLLHSQILLPYFFTEWLLYRITTTLTIDMQKFGMNYLQKLVGESAAQKIKDIALKKNSAGEDGGQYLHLFIRWTKGVNKRNIDQFNYTVIFSLSVGARLVVLVSDPTAVKQYSFYLGHSATADYLAYPSIFLLMAKDLQIVRYLPYYSYRTPRDI